MGRFNMFFFIIIITHLSIQNMYVRQFNDKEFHFNVYIILLYLLLLHYNAITQEYMINNKATPIDFIIV